MYAQLYCLSIDVHQAPTRVHQQVHHRHARGTSSIECCTLNCYTDCLLMYTKSGLPIFVVRPIRGVNPAAIPYLTARFPHGESLVCTDSVQVVPLGVLAQRSGVSMEDTNHESPQHKVKRTQE